MNFAVPFSRVFVALCVSAPFTFAAEKSAEEGIAFFEKRIRPVLVEHCYECHDAKKAKGNLRLDFRDGWAKGGASGPAIVPGKPDDSLLIKGVRHWDKDFRMPEKPLPPALVADLVEWVKLGAPDPRTNAPTATSIASKAAKPTYGVSLEEGRKHWAYQPVKAQPLPKLKDKSWPRNELDHFTLARMEKAGVTPAPDTDPRTLIRRLTFDLTGLPPTAEEVEAFVKQCEWDSKSSAFRIPHSALVSAVDRLLASPHYGERWGRHWLDVVRYADTCGNASDYPVPQAYKFRNYVIKAFNEDKPFDRFIREQLAGDLLNAKLETPNPELTIAPGYLAIARHFGGGKGEAHLTIEDGIENMGRAFLGLSLSCARCHDHKFDPIASTDYYALYGIFSSTTFPHPGSEGMNRPANLVALGAKAEVEAATKAWKDQLAALDAEVKKLEADKAAADKLTDPAEKKAKADEATKAIAAAKAKHKQLSETTPYELAYAVADTGKPANARIHVRGDPTRLGEEVPRRFVQVLGGQPLPKDCGNSGRLELANWIADPANPLTARVLVNRLWQHHFGRGLVTTPNDFGTRGQAPTHPELLDFLAQKFIASGWSVKAMHRELMLTAAWQQGSLPREEGLARDADNRYLWRMNRRRLDVESWRDALLAVSGRLDSQLGGASTNLSEAGNTRRTVYAFVSRHELDNMLRLFDFPDANITASTRSETTVPQQQLFVINSPFMLNQARAFAARLQQDAGDDNAARITLAFRLSFGRSPSADELQLGLAYVTAEDAADSRDGTSLNRWERYAQILLASNEFMYQIGRAHV